jgi:hypothetical protein
MSDCQTDCLKGRVSSAEFTPLTSFIEFNVIRKRVAHVSDPPTQPTTIILNRFIRPPTRLISNFYLLDLLGQCVLL